MTKTVTISENLAALLAERARADGYSSLDAAAEALISKGLIADDPGDDHSDGRSVEDLRALIGEADASGNAVSIGPGDLRAEILRRHAGK